ncbi:TetR/AcrR family transcriptional regulator [Paenibacillus terrigena]|uniref:TetR/AcrR family transcriptional regulator n=1 Tax=Paenibacillus terrigena TaxID=369333 RepID=UPI00037FBA99|nr:TetR/AcrR family transcriptional regulator [Paenibacillus terrigena]
MVDVTRKEDRRIQRTRELLRRGFIEVIREKGFDSMNIQDIADRANVNRGTFYLHYNDKYMLLDEIVRDTFKKMLRDAVPHQPRWERGTLRLIVLTVLNCFEEKYRHRQPSSRIPSALLENAIRDELTFYLACLIGSESSDSSKESHAKAHIVGWAIFGAATQWSREIITMSAEQMADVICSVIVTAGYNNEL